MMRCLNCIHFDVCDIDRHENEQYFGDCSDFINDRDVEAVLYGKWEFVNQATNYLEPPYGDTCRCSVCGFEIDISETYFKRCPECGAKMDRKKEEE